MTSGSVPSGNFAAASSLSTSPQGVCRRSVMYWEKWLENFEPDQILPSLMISSVAARSGSADVYELSLRKQIAEAVAVGVSLRDFKLADGHSRTLGLELVVRF